LEVEWVHELGSRLEHESAEEKEEDWAHELGKRLVEGLALTMVLGLVLLTERALAVVWVQ
jgi:hypothetical protein